MKDIENIDAGALLLLPLPDREARVTDAKHEARATIRHDQLVDDISQINATSPREGSLPSGPHQAA